VASDNEQLSTEESTAMFELLFQSSKLKGRRLTLPLGKEIVIGRETGCQLMLNSPAISRKHCEIKHVAEGIWVRDLDSQNGTYVNDVAIATPTLMRAGDVLRVGNTAFEVQVSQLKPKTPSKGDSVSESEIAAWLTDHGSSPTSDTAIIPSGLADRAKTPAVPVRRFKSVKEEAADIIRRHQEQKQG